MSDFSNSMGLAFADRGGLKGITNGIINAENMRRRGELDGASKAAQAYASNMLGNLNHVRAQDASMTLDNRRNIEDIITKNPHFAGYLQNAMRMFALTGKGDPNNLAQASGHFQKQASIDNIVAGTQDPTATAQGYAATSGAAPFGNSNALGYSTNKITGGQPEGDPVVAKLFRGLQGAKIAHENASASAQRALATNRQEKPGGMTPAQSRTNTEIDAARDALAGMTQDQIDALEKKDSMSLTAGDKQKLAIIKLARRAKFGEGAIPTTPVQPAPVLPPKQGFFDRLFSFPQPTQQPVAQPVQQPAQQPAPKAGMTSAKMPEAVKIRQQYQRGEISRDEARRRLQALAG